MAKIVIYSSIIYKKNGFAICTFVVSTLDYTLSQEGDPHEIKLLWPLLSCANIQIAKVISKWKLESKFSATTSEIKFKMENVRLIYHLLISWPLLSKRI